MIPYLLAIAGGYLIGASQKKQIFSEGGSIKGHGIVGDARWELITSGERLDYEWIGHEGDIFWQVYNLNGEIYILQTKGTSIADGITEYVISKLSEEEATEEGWLEYAKGGMVSKYKIFEGYDYYNSQPIFQVIGVEDEYEGEWHTDRKDAEKEIAELEGKYAQGGEIRYKLKGNNFSDKIENGRKFKESIAKTYQNLNGEYPENFISETAYTAKIVKHDGSNYVKDYTYKGTLSKFKFLDDKDFLEALKYLDRPAIRKFEDGGVTYAQGGEIAQTILQQLGGAGRLHAMTGAYNFIDRGNGLSFKIKNQRANYIKITLNSKDLYDVEVGRVRGTTYKVVKSANDLYFDQLKPFIEEATGMYLSLFADGGEVKIKAKEVKLKDSQGDKFFEGDNITEADEALYFIWKRGTWSDVYYEIEFENGTELEGSIDLEPKSFHADHKKNILSWHIKTLWENISKTDKPYISKEDKEFGSDLLKNYDLDYKKGGKIKKKRTKFVDKVDAIADRLEGQKVPKILQKDYGKTYNRDEAEEAGRRIAGAQLRDLKNKK